MLHLGSCCTSNLHLRFKYFRKYLNSRELQNHDSRCTFPLSFGESTKQYIVLNVLYVNKGSSLYWSFLFSPTRLLWNILILSGSCRHHPSKVIYFCLLYWISKSWIVYLYPIILSSNSFLVIDLMVSA